MASTNQVNTVTTENVVPVGATYDANGNFITLIGAAGAPIPFSGGSGSFTTLSASGTVTLSGGTANGVAYLNGSKVLTTGSGLVFDSSGNLLVGTTSIGDNKNYFMFSPGNAFGDFAHESGVASGVSYTRFLYAGSLIGSITQSGTTAVLYNVTSDQRLKENIVDAPEFGSVIDSLQVRSFDWKTDQTHQRAGFVAQELVTVAPEAVHQPADPEEMMAVDYSKLIPMLVKEIQSLRIRIAQLEAK